MGSLLELVSPKPLAQVLQVLLNLALYLCQEAPDLGAFPRKPPEVRVKKGRVQVHPPEAPLVIPTGWRWGRPLRAFREAKGREGEERGGTGRSVAPHIRRAHWHLYWTGEGARKDPSRATPWIRWVPATLVGRKWLLEAGLSEEDLPAVVRKIKDKWDSGPRL
ncbi:hypothetical protein YIM73518_25950 [Thermus brockianus]|uniref:hypothetical protein n=1 Tax=Thermus thermophilus TaxID=274 RepID=UPI00059EA5E6|nr:hypothetical protein [Thermus thermophilus]